VKRFILPILIFFILITAASFVQSDDKIICDYCKEEIRGQYIEFHGKTYHPIHFRCDNCGKPIGHTEYFVKGDHKYCRECYIDLFAPKCAYCGKPVEEDYAVYRGKPYHKDCLNEHVALTCDLCNRPVFGEYLTDYWGNNYCIKHENNYNSCTYCGRFISDRVTHGGVTYRDGRHVCGICMPYTVNDENKAWGLTEEVISLMTSLGIEFDFSSLELHLVDKDELRQKSKNKMADQNGLCLYEEISQNGTKIRRDFDIYILEGMPKPHFISTAAHELMHVWIYNNAPRGSDPILVEGSCNLASYLVLQNYKSDMSEYIISLIEKNPDPIYGDGFRKVKALYKHEGISGWLEYLKNNKSISSRY